MAPRTRPALRFLDFFASWIPPRQREEAVPRAAEPYFSPPAAKGVKRDAWTLELLKVVEPRKVDFLCAAYFEALGFRVEITRKGPEGPVDLRLYAPNQPLPGILAHCRAWSTNPVAEQVVRDLLGVMATERIGEGTLIAMGAFSSQARAAARDRNLHLIDGEDFLGKLLALPAERREALLSHAAESTPLIPTCASCGMKMIRKEDKNDGLPYWDCVRHPLRSVAVKATL